MSLNDTPLSERIHIGIYGKRNAGKSSLINALTGQDLSVVSEVAGTTTDPVKKAMELLPLGPVVFIDTPGTDDSGSLGELRVQRAYQCLNKTDIAVVTVDAAVGCTPEDLSLIEKIKEKKIPLVLVLNKSETAEEASLDREREKASGLGVPVLCVSARSGENIYELKELICSLAPEDGHRKKIASDLCHEGELVILVVPVDKSAPKGRLILPQQQTIRDLIDNNQNALIVRETQLESVLKRLNIKPALVITDSQIFRQVAEIVPRDIPLTSFSILFARYKGDLKGAADSVKKLEELRDGDKILICEGCTHHRQCGDIGTVKLPAWIEKYTGKKPQYFFTSGGDFPEDLSEYALIIHCGGCTLNEREMRHRFERARLCGVPMTNYGVFIAYINGILERASEGLF